MGDLTVQCCMPMHNDDWLVAINARPRRLAGETLHRTVRASFANANAGSKRKISSASHREQLRRKVIQLMRGSTNDQDRIQALHVTSGNVLPIVGQDFEKVELRQLPIAPKHDRHSVRKYKSLRIVHS
ncbi:hypothetical protein [Novosphingobium sp. B 225]|uniref:hypothetical protein n=1 Tax=Novosphingobium sp. B 225 TaxID=1961849 RepID=UPI001124F7BB|nr:hypothetical protein [Novosphingobium sp. B 225]